MEELRQIAIRRREAQGESEAGQPFAEGLESVHSLDVVQAYRLARAFAFYFELINLAETNHRKRRRLSLQLSGEAQRGSLRGTLRAMKAAGITSNEAVEWLRSICIIPVFTAHPTEVARRVVMFKRRRIADLLEQLDRIPLSDEQLETLEESLTAEITALWETDEVRTRRPTVADEVKMGLDYYDASIYATLPGLYAEVAAAFEAEYDLCLSLADMPLLLSFGSWIGGDRDGNPFVTPQITREALQMARDNLLTHYQQELQLILDLLTSSAQQAPVSGELEEHLHAYLEALNTTGQQAFGERFEYESYRRFLSCIRVRLAGVGKPGLNQTLQPGPRIGRPAGIPLGAGVAGRSAGTAYQPGAEPRAPPGARVNRPTATGSAHLRAAPANTGYSPARATACRCARRSLGLEMRPGASVLGSAATHARLGRCDGYVSRHRRAEAVLRAGGDSPLRHQRSGQHRRHSQRDLVGSPGRRARGRQRHGAR